MYSQTICAECGGSVIEYDAAAGNGFCVGCGTVVEENTIVSEVAFGESSSGAAIVQGSFVGQGSSEYGLRLHCLSSLTMSHRSACPHEWPVWKQKSLRIARADAREWYADFNTAQAVCSHWR